MRLFTIERHKRPAGETKYPLRKMMVFAWEGITSFSIVPLRVASLSGFLIFLGAVGLMVWALATKLSGEAVPGWTSILIPLLCIGGLNVLFLGLIGECIGKVYLEVKKRPLFIVKERNNFTESEHERE